MPRTAIVTLSCPHCGGRTDGVRSIESPQTIPCPYCRTELHVPAVGERVIERERIIERVVEVTPEPEPTNPVVAWTLVLLFVVGMLILLVMRCAAPSVPSTSTWQDKQAQRQACTQPCVASCPTADRDDLADDRVALDRELARSTCMANCELTCMDLKPLDRRR